MHVRFFILPLIVASNVAVNAQIITGFGVDYTNFTADRLKPATRNYTELGYGFKRWSALAQFRTSTGITEWTQPDWLAGGRIEYYPYTLPTDSLPFDALKAVNWRVTVSAQWTQSDNARFRSEHLGPYSNDHWIREIYQFKHNKSTFWVGAGLHGHLGGWSLLAEVQLAPYSNLDTWVYKASLYPDGREIIQDDYYYYERFMRIRGAVTLRKHMGF